MSLTEPEIFPVSKSVPAPKAAITRPTQSRPSEKTTSVGPKGAADPRLTSAAAASAPSSSSKSSGAVPKRLESSPATFTLTGARPKELEGIKFPVLNSPKVLLVMIVRDMVTNKRMLY